jgi:hypothetical protein
VNVKRVLALALTAAATLGLAACTSPQEVNRDIGTIHTAEGTAGTVSLEQAAVAADGYFANSGSYAGFTPTTAAAEEPSINWTIGAAVVGSVSIRGADATSVALVTKDASGAIQCVGLTSGVKTTGTQDAQSAAGCTG